MAKLLHLVLTLLFITAAADTAQASLRISPANKTKSPDWHPQAVDQSLDHAIGQVKNDVADAATDDDSSEADKVEAPTSQPRTFLSSKIAPAVQASDASTPESLEMTSSAMEKAMTDLMLGNSVFGATPMGGSVKKISDLVRKTMMPKVKAAHVSDQKELLRLIAEVKKCGSTKNNALRAAVPETKKYRSESKSHKNCRADEAVKFTTKKNCLVEQKSAFQLKKAECDKFSVLSKKLGTTKDNRAVVTKAGSESTESYITRISATICGKHTHGKKGTKKTTGGWGGGLSGGFLDQYWRSREKCEKATKRWKDKVKECKAKVALYNVRIGQCNQFQKLMDAASCKSAIIANDACQSYSECYKNTVALYKTTEGVVSINELDRKAEWRGLHRIDCLIEAFADGKVTDKEVTACKKRTIDTKPMNIKFPKVPALQKCTVSQLYPSTGKYKRTEFGPLPMLAKGMESVPCSGMREVSTIPRAGSPKTCKCTRVSLNGAYSAHGMVACKNCIDVRRSNDKNSCPKGTKIFSPASRDDWKTFLASAKPLNAPHFIVDVTNPTNGCGGCKNHAMNSRVAQQKAWRTSDGSSWWLRSTRYGEPNGDYEANCYLNVRANNGVNSLTFNDARCHYHSKSYYCQLQKVNLKPGGKSPKTCKCSIVDLTGAYSPGKLIKCEQCIDVKKATQSNSCPRGTKIFSPRTRGDWKTFIGSAQPLRAPHFIIDVTRPADGCGGCKKHAMNSKVPAQATWRTQDRSPWWLRSSRYSEPSGDYKANCFMDLWRSPHNSENNIQFNDGRCNYHSRSYFCQPKQVKKPPPPAPAPPPPPPAWYCVARLSKKQVKGPFKTLAKAQNQLNKNRGTSSNAQMVCEMTKAGAKKDPHFVGGKPQGGGPNHGFQKWWRNWNQIRQMNAMCNADEPCKYNKPRKVDPNTKFCGNVKFGTCKAKGLKYGQYTTCGSMSAKGKYTTCHNPTIQYGNTKFGAPAKHSSNRYGQWCKQLGFKSSRASAQFGSRTCKGPGGKGKLFWCGGYDESSPHWCDWADGKWRNQRLDYQCNGQMVTAVTCFSR